MLEEEKTLPTNRHKRRYATIFCMALKAPHIFNIYEAIGKKIPS
tara:strand:- start:2021 stop:2152 length:132 start_codon:yes stop_codon:yes gene_type:complete